LESAIVYDLWTIFQVILVDLALGGDNSIVIGMAAKNLPQDLQKKAILYGTAGAIAMRILMAAMVIWLLQIPYLKTVGAVLLIAIGIKLIGANDDDEEVNVEAKDSLFDAIRTIIAADALMSLDNVLGIVGTTGGISSWDGLLAAWSRQTSRWPFSNPMPSSSK
jgi:YjbE family integral membrane protein